MAARSHSDSVGFKERSLTRLLTTVNCKTPKGEKAGYLTGVLYLMPHTSGGAKTLCPHSTDACRAMCLAGAGLSGLPRQLAAKQVRTDLYHEARGAFLAAIVDDISAIATAAAREGLGAAIRLNGSSDILWEREIAMDPALVWYDYTKTPPARRAQRPSHYHLTFSYAGPQDLPVALSWLAQGGGVAAVVPGYTKIELLEDVRQIALPDGTHARFVDGDENDLRFLDPPSSIVLLTPKGRVRSDLVRPNLRAELTRS